MDQAEALGLELDGTRPGDGLGVMAEGRIPDRPLPLAPAAGGEWCRSLLGAGGSAGWGRFDFVGREDQEPAQAP